MATPKRPIAQSVKVLVIEDEADVCEVVEKRLRTAGSFEVSTATGGVQGLHAAGALKPDVVLLDLAMPGFDGWDVCRALRSDPELQDVAIVLMTARWETDAESLARAFKIQRVLFKPLDFDELVETLRAAA